MKPQLLCARDLFVHAGESRSPLVRPVDVTLDVGDVLVLTGPSGVGKTTLLRCLAGLEPRAVGEVRFHGKLVADHAVPGFRRRVQLVPQHPVRVARTVHEHWASAFAVRSASTPYEHAAALHIAEQLALPQELVAAPLNQLSGGELQRVGLIRALLCEPEVLLLDEPTGALDPDNRERVLAVLQRWLSEGHRATAMVVHHDEGLASWATRTQMLPERAP